uniref:Ceramide kinase C-terminal domain-containing protein n=1 Tax=Labrus bergylta TaxID=56723 RepID=A0A3Q3FG76_9LABR
MVLRAQLDAGSPEKPVKQVLPLGIIPAGDILKLSLCLCAGHKQQVDMCSFTSLGQLVCFGFSAMFGFGGRSLARAEKKRWMPSGRRREYALVKTLARLSSCHASSIMAEEMEFNTNVNVLLYFVILHPCLATTLIFS